MIIRIIYLSVIFQFLKQCILLQFANVRNLDFVQFEFSGAKVQIQCKSGSSGSLDWENRILR